MLTLRPLPPAAADHPDPLLGAYYSGLLGAWDGRDRAIGRAASRWLVGLKADGQAARYGVPADEWPVMRGLVPIAGYVSMQMRKGLHRVLNPAAFPLKNNHFKDKALFAAAAGAAGLRLPPTLTAGTPVGPWLADQKAVLLKPSFSSHGRGIRRWVRGNGTWHGAGGQRMDAAAFAKTVSGLLAKGGVAQAALATHHSLVDVSPDALPTLRLVTLRDEVGAPEIALRVLRVGGGGSPVDNFAFGGLAVTLKAGGRACLAFSRAADGRPSPCRRHPQTGARLDGGIDAGTAATADALALEAHARLGEGYAAIAWDVGLSAAGPVLIEGNWNPGTNIMQLLQKRPLSQGRIGELYRLALGRVPASAWAAARPVQSDGR